MLVVQDHGTHAQLHCKCRTDSSGFSCTPAQHACGDCPLGVCVGPWLKVKVQAYVMQALALKFDTGSHIQHNFD